MKNILTYTEGILDFYKIPTFESPQQSASYLWQNRDKFIANALCMFEGIALSLADTKNILGGYCADSLSVRDTEKTYAYGCALKQLCSDIHDQIFLGDRYDLIELHRIAAKYEIESTHVGLFRRENVRLKNVQWLPPDYSELQKYWAQVQRQLEKRKRIFENSLVIFLMLARTQFFPDVNKRTAFLFANGLLLKNSLSPLFIDCGKKEEFCTLLIDFYETGNADNLLLFLIKFITLNPDTNFSMKHI